MCVEETGFCCGPLGASLVASAVSAPLLFNDAGFEFMGLEMRGSATSHKKGHKCQEQKCIILTWIGEMVRDLVIA